MKNLTMEMEEMEEEERTKWRVKYIKNPMERFIDGLGKKRKESV